MVTGRYTCYWGWIYDICASGLLLLEYTHVTGGGSMTFVHQAFCYRKVHMLLGGSMTFVHQAFSYWKVHMLLGGSMTFVHHAFFTGRYTCYRKVQGGS